MDFKTITGSVSITLGHFSKKQKREFNAFLYGNGFRGDLTKAWKDYQDASLKASRSKKK